jgi:NAD(P)-dependent dehydrogenase (short-subunit alcohol dehydrogenase family)
MPTVILTGATRGIGHAAAIELAGRGAELGVVGRDAARVRATAEQARASRGGAPVHEHVADLERMDEVRRLAAELLEAYPRIDVLANNAGAMFTSRHVTPGGFEGLRVIPEELLGDDPAVAHRNDVRQLDVRLRAPAYATPACLTRTRLATSMKSPIGSRVSTSQVSRTCCTWRMTASRPTNGPGSGQSSGARQ